MTYAAFFTSCDYACDYRPTIAFIAAGKADICIVFHSEPGSQPSFDVADDSVGESFPFETFKDAVTAVKLHFKHDIDIELPEVKAFLAHVVVLTQQDELTSVNA